MSLVVVVVAAIVDIDATFRIPYCWNLPWTNNYRGGADGPCWSQHGCCWCKDPRNYVSVLVVEDDSCGDCSSWNLVVVAVEEVGFPRRKLPWKTSSLPT